MIVIVNKRIPFKGFVIINLFGIVFARKEKWDKASDLQKSIYLNHAEIISAQARELLWVFFYLAYFFEWLYYLLKLHDCYKAHQRVSFERDAYRHDLDFMYTYNRRHYSQWKR